ncbi:hypothetical protein EMIHUDRAFT_310744 [Emiliania huxleyi CCMP1516]|uniref:RAP domain-containing protein n=2 Tax=Emiliania huxleyi TaxID=2903 RepID=A0A0D3J2K4_EMIH1|nr:hypothetical protein EMIHUDRAFT_310744 [Emiliania huxleyi CCMP1516]EOD17739.1 hypothetical protein EMIHUDRAFT_310744 [Emiliania huxleyi CCMP1516]|eukprot:XP_005770168.1 hypothetical protein EMIHUDRAFT_310744 [Emiliania huxleyi CCMP1516]
MQAQGTQVTISRLQRSVADSLATVRYGFKEEYLEPRTGYSLDLAFWLPSSRIAIEACAPNGPTKLKRRLLAAACWRMISVPFHEWDSLNTADERQAYLERAVGSLAAAAPCQPGSSSPIASRGQGPDYEADSCGSPSGSPSPQEEAEPRSAEVRCEVARYALDEGRLRMLVEEQGASFSATVASVVVDKLCGFIAAAKGMARRTTRCKRLQRSRLRRHAPTSRLSRKT